MPHSLVIDRARGGCVNLHRHGNGDKRLRLANLDGDRSSRLNNDGRVFNNSSGIRFQGRGRFRLCHGLHSSSHVFWQGEPQCSGVLAEVESRNLRQMSSLQDL